MRKSIIASLMSGVAILGSIIPAVADTGVDLSYEVAETPGSAVFHLDTTAIAYTKTELQKPVSYHISTTAGNYYANTTAADAKNYTVSIADTEIVDATDSNRKFSVTFGTAKTHALDLTETSDSAVSDSITSTLGANGDNTDKAGSYSGRATVTFEEA